MSGWYNRDMGVITWFFVILLADLAAAMLYDVWSDWRKPKRGRPRKARTTGLAKILPFRKAD